VSRIDEHWYRGSLWLWLLWPVSALFCLLVMLRRLFFRTGVLRSVRLPVPVIVVGNITVGGSGKTPLVLWLAEYLREQGYKPGLISRGYGGKAQHWPQPVGADSDPRVVGDEALLLARRSGCPMVVGPDRVAAARRLLAEHGVNVIISDDGMQHYRLGRDIEIAVLDGERRLANGLCLPAGPLREPSARLRSVDFVVTNGEGAKGEWSMQLEPAAALPLLGGESRPLSSFAATPLHAVAGIGNPGRFFATLRRLGLATTEHAFADHHPYRSGELDFDDELPVLMTEKDAVKYFDYAGERHWYLPVTAHLPEDFGRRLLAVLEKPHG
jgi:tetraacyldisaccharide 4'-kinase